MLICKKKVREYALDRAAIAGCRGRDRVSKSFMQGIEYAVRQAIEQRVNAHDNSTGFRKTLV